MLTVQLYFQSADETATSVHFVISATSPSVPEVKVADEVCASVHWYILAPYFTMPPTE